MIIKPIPYGHQNITEDDIVAVIETLKSDYLTQGPKIKEFEDNFAKYIGCKFAVAVANGTAALHISAMALNVRPGNKVITSPITFVASPNCVRFCGGEVVFADIDSTTYLLDIESVKRLLEDSPRGTYQGIIPVDFAGRAVNMEQFRKLANEYGMWIIEDACHAPGGYFYDSYRNKHLCGNSEFADLSIFSFHPVKHITCGEGGMVTTNNEVLYKELLRLRSHGITKGDDKYINSIEFASGGYIDETEYPGWYMEMQEIGYNYRLTDIQAALGNSQLKKNDAGLIKRKEIAKKYNIAFKNKPYILNQSDFVDGHAYHLYVIEVKDRLNLYRYLRKNNIIAQIHYIPAHLMPYYRQFGWKEGDLPKAEKYYSKCISIPMFPTLTNEEQEYVIETINRFYNE
ncbi:MAG: UDP-4-amino-4,6-dideoxy-N-acetyl-beta-L-altrosamine transaminase [Bacteroidales bacterium]|nr:UDP-4-amino-4,6-dideoxy-N-acetyl-beta-L-altrosamine transaminase [Bacteroidales bacterium]